MALLEPCPQREGTPFRQRLSLPRSLEHTSPSVSAHCMSWLTGKTPERGAVLSTPAPSVPFPTPVQCTMNKHPWAKPVVGDC